MADGARRGRGAARSWLRLGPGRRLATFAVALTVVLLAAGAALAWSAYLAKKRAAEREVEFVSRAAVVSANSFLLRAEQTLVTLAATEPVRELDHAGMLALFHRARPTGTFPGGLSWLDAQGRLVVTSDLPLARTPRTDFSFRDHVRAVARTRRPAVGRVVVGRRVPYPLFVVAAPTFSPDGRFTGILTGTVRLNASSTVSRALTLGRRDVRIGDRVGTLVVGPEPNAELQPFLDARALDDLGGRLRPGLHVGVDVDGRESVVALARTTRGGWWVASVEPESSVYAAARRTLFTELLGLVLLAGLLVAASLLFASRTERLYAAFRRRAEAERAARGRAELLQAVAARLASARDGDEVASAIVEETALALGAASASVFLTDPATGRIGIRASRGYDPELGGRLRQALADDAPIPAVEACRTGRIVTLETPDELRERYPALWDIGIRSSALVAVPLEIESGRVGAAGWTFAAPRRFDASFEQLVRAIAQHAALALERARLFEAEREARTVAEQERVRLGALQRLSASLAVAPTIDAVADAIVSHARSPLQASTCALALLDDEGTTLHIRRDVGYPPGTIDHLRGGVPLEAEVPVARVTRTGAPLFFHDLDEIAEAFPGMLPVFRRVGRAGAVLPLTGTTAVLGGVVLAFAEEQAFDLERRDELETFARLCAQAIERASLFEAEQALRVRDAKMRTRAELVAGISSSVEATMGLARRAQVLVDLLVPRVADLAVVEHHRDGAPRLLGVAHADPTAVEALRASRAEAAADPAHPLSVADVERRAAPVLLSRADARPGEPHSAIAVPIRARGQTAAVLLLGLVDPARRPYDAGDLDLALEIAGRMGFAFDNARLYEQEHEIALRLQRALLPARLLEHDAISVAGRYEAGHAEMEVGGDWFDTIALPGGRVGIAVGDVVGRGVAAAAAMGRLRTAMAALAPSADGPGALLHELERFAEHVDGAEFATACYGILDPSTGELLYASAGHVPMLLVERDGTSRLLEDGRSAPLCGLGPEPRPEAAATMSAGSTLVVFTDGLVERRREHLSAGLERLAEAAGRLARVPVDALCEGLLADLTEGRHLHDDVALLCLRLEHVSPRPLELRFPGRADELRSVRCAVRDWCVEAGVRDALADDVVLAVSEACANAIEHAYHGRRAGEVELELHLASRVVHATVRDFGAWRLEGPVGDRGRGTPIMEALATRVERTTGAAGTTVRMRFGIGHTAQDAPSGSAEAATPVS